MLLLSCGCFWEGSKVFVEWLRSLDQGGRFLGIFTVQGQSCPSDGSSQLWTWMMTLNSYLVIHKNEDIHGKHGNTAPEQIRSGLKLSLCINCWTVYIYSRYPLFILFFYSRTLEQKSLTSFATLSLQISPSGGITRLRWSDRLRPEYSPGASAGEFVFFSSFLRTLTLVQ